eukprot:167018-Amphidinium_carterae.1
MEVVLCEVWTRRNRFCCGRNLSEEKKHPKESYTKECSPKRNSKNDQKCLKTEENVSKYDPLCAQYAVYHAHSVAQAPSA